MSSVSVLLICKDEAANLPDWLESVRPFADQIVAVDSGSSDGTVEILEEAGALVMYREWSGFSDQRNFAASLCSCDWIIYLDADEWPDERLAQSINQLKTDGQPGVDAFRIASKVYFFGKFLRHGGFYPEWHLRMYRRGKGHWPKREVHECLEVKGPVVRLPGNVHHHSYQNVGQYIRRMEGYSASAANELFIQGKRASGLQAAGHAAWNFMHRYILRLGLLDGFEGYLAARLEAMYTLAKYARLREMIKSRGGSE
jgi:glycosyltransferase involved in cell wall biosynthesis